MVEIPRGDINIFEKIDEIEEYLRLKPRRTVTIQEMFSQASNRREAVVLFLALLELIKLGRVRAYQASPFSTIEIKSVWSRRDVV
jgi:segregation and condensation protein A